MKEETLDLDQQRQWMQQWRHAEKALQQVKLAELARMSDTEALIIANRLLSSSNTQYRDPHRQTFSGLVEQQRLFHKKKFKDEHAV